MAADMVREVTSIDKSQWKPEEYELAFFFVNFARMANSVVTESGPLQGWFSEALWRHYSYAPFNGRVMENYYSLAFFYGYDAPWNIYYKNPAVLHRLELALNYTFDLMGENGAIPEYATANMDTPMLAPSSFGMEYMTASLAVAGDVLPDALKHRLIAQARKAAVYVLTSEESWDHARAFTNQFLGAMAGGARLAKLTGDDELMDMVNRAGEALLEEGNFMAPMGFLYENNGPETFAYFFVTLSRLIPMWHEWGDSRTLEVLRRHCAWMSKWMLPEPDGQTVLLAGAHQTRTGGSYRVSRRNQYGLGELLSGKSEPDSPGAETGINGLADLVANGHDERRFLKLFLGSDDEVADKHRKWEGDADLVAALKSRSLRDGYHPVSMLQTYAPYAPTAEEQKTIVADLPCLKAEMSFEVETDDRGNQYGFFRFPKYYTGVGFATRRTTANHGPNFLWHAEGGTVILSENGDRACWETRNEKGGTGKATATATIREGRGGHEVLVNYGDLGLRKTYVFKPDVIDVQLGARNVSEIIPLLLRESDTVHLDYGHCPAGGMSSRVLGVVTQTVAIERSGKQILRLDLGAPVSATLKPSLDADGFVRVTLTFSPAQIYFGKTGYRVFVG